MKFKNLMGTMAVFACAAFALVSAAVAGDIYEILPCDQFGTTVSPAGDDVYLKGGDTAYFKVRLAKRTSSSRLFHLSHKGSRSEVLDMLTKPPAIGIYVDGRFTTAAYVTENELSSIYTDFVFSYTVKPGEFALPIRLADDEKKIINNDQSAPSTAYYFNFRDESLGTPVWDIDDSTATAEATVTADFSFGTSWPYPTPQPEGETRVKDYDLSKCKFQVKAIDFSPNEPEDSVYWRSVHEGTSALEGSESARLVIDGIPTNSVRLYLWSEDETVFRLPDGVKKPIHFNGPDAAASDRLVLTIDVVAGKQEYDFKLWGVTKGTVTNLVLSAFPDFNYNTGFSEPVRLKDYLAVPVRCSEPLPPSVSVKVGRSPVIAKDGSHTNKVTEVLVEFSQPFDQDVDIEIKPKFTDESGKADHDWYDYLRFSFEGNENVALQEQSTYTAFPKVRIEKGQTKPTLYLRKDVWEPLLNGAVCVYALYGDKFSNAEEGQFNIGLDTANEAAKKPSSEGGIDGWTRTDALVVQAADPSLSSKKATLNPTVNTDCAFDIKVSDTWTALKSGAGYKLYYQSKDAGVDPVDNDWKEVKADAIWNPDASGILKDANGKSPALQYPLARTYITWFYVEGPNGQTSGKEADDGFSVTVIPSRANAVTALVSDDDQATWKTTGKFDEGTEFYVTVELESPIPSGETVYAFLAPVGRANEFVTGDAVTNSSYTSGIKIPGGETKGSKIIPSSFELIDGTRKGEALQFDVILCKTQTFDPAQIVTGCQSETLQIMARNVEPAFVQVTMDKVAKVENAEETMHTGKGKTEKTAFVPIGVPKEFVVKVKEPSDVDLEATGEAEAGSPWDTKDFTIEYTIVEENGATDAGELTGNPASTNFTYTFTGAGIAEVTLRMHDKDMNDWTEEFTFYVEVTAQPSVVIELPEAIDETMTGYSLAPINLSLSDYGTGALTAKVTVACNETVETDRKKLGFVRIGGALNTEPYVDEKGREYYLVVLTGGKARLFVDEADGTDLANRKGFTISAEIVDTGTDPVTKKVWKDYYLSESRILYVANTAPVLLDCTLGDTVSEGNTNAVKVGIGEVITVDYRVDDIIADMTNGIKVQWWDTDNKNAAVTNVYSSTNLCMFSTKFKSSGPKTIRVTLTDKDSKPTYVGEWNFLVESTKTLITVANGPGQGPSTLSARYSGAKGSGEGHVWSDASFAFADNFWINWNCNPSAMSANVFGWGYKTNAVDNGTLDSGTIYQHDIPLGSKASAHGLGGNTTESGKSALDDCYKYAGAVDSFLYGWIYHAMGEGGGSGSSGLTSTFQALAPERTERGAAATSVPLPDGNQGDKSATATITYPTVYMEAVFAREYLPSDNMGDINADGIPDLYLLVSDYDFGVVDPATGELTGNDLRDLNFTEGEDPEPYCLDYLPTTELSVYSHLIPGLPESWGGETGTGKPFIPRLKVRGFDETDPQSIAKRGGLSASALNDAPTKWAGVAGVKPDQVYTNPREDEYSTLNYVEWLAWSEYKAAHPTATEKDWSPERPTNPTRKDTDGDGLTDGYEYYFWYMAHVGYIENGVHRYLSGRAYNPRNPGEGDFIDSETLASAFDPLTPTAYKLRDTDNDGLPDALEFLIGTNPIDFDTDGDGLPDGFEIMLGGTDPLLASTTKGVSDAMRNFDGDAMAFTTPYLEANGAVLPQPLVVDSIFTFALVDEKGDTDGIQWYVGRTAPTNIVASAETKSGVSFTLADNTNVTYVTSRATLPVVDGRLACDLLKSEVRTMVSTNDDFGVEGNVNIALMPVLIRAGTPVTNVSETVVEYRTLSLAADLENASTAWVYGRSVSGETTGDTLANMGGFGMLAIGRYQTAKAGLELAALPAKDDGVAYLHHFVYQEFGFDPRTAWNANTPLAPRWGKTVTTGEGETESTETVANNFTANYGYAGVATRTREYTLYDEFLVLSFFLNNGKLAEADVTPTQAVPWEKIWSKYTTNGQGPNEPNWEPDNEHFKGRTAETASGDNGADTDMDGVPDGWELYVMAGPKVEDKKTKEKLYNLVAPYNDGFFSAFGPFVKEAANASMTDNNATGGRSSAGGDADGLTELQEYAGTDSCAYYCEPWGGNAAPFSATIIRPAEHKLWLNKFFPTDPWNGDTDGDGLGDSAEAGKFKYGTAVDDGKTCSIPGGGLNPCTVDTDLDGLPDPWEAQFAGKTVYAGADAQIMEGKDGTKGNPRQGYCDGMDGTVPDAFNTPHISTSTGSASKTEVIVLNGIAQVVDRDYDKDGLDNWQEYMTGAMRVWRYDDPRSSFDWGDKAPAGKAGAIVPDGAFFDDEGNFSLSAAKLYTGIQTDDEFWYRLLFDRESKWYNPHFITGTAPGTEYFSRVTNGWDQAFTETGSYYIFFDRQNDQMYKDTWGYMGAAPTKYICTSPIDADTDHDGMDDGYELFHGLNPLLGAAAVLASEQGPCDIVFDAWYKRPVGSPIDALNNKWTSGRIPADFDFTVNPWLNGLVDADPDGDDIRNQDEAIMPLVAPSQTWFHTDPTPLWMTDSSYRDSLVTRFFRMPNALGVVPVPESVEFDGKTYFTRDLDGYVVLPLIGPAIAPFTLEYWDVPLAYAPNWMYSFEENEGYDTDHDAGSDFEELQGKVRSKTDPQDADSPRRRQAMYFPGPAEPSALQSMPFVRELYPRAASGYPDDLSFLQYTVECWVRPESTADATVLERTSYVHPSHVADERYVRRNFAIMIRSGKWCTEFDANGTLDASTVRVLGKTDVKPGEWTYVAATYDANNLILYVNGGEDGRTASSLKPEYGSSAVVVYPAGSTVVSTNNGAGAGADIVQSGDHSYWFDSEYSLNAFLVGASFTNGDGKQLDVTAGTGFAGRYTDFFTGYVDEIRVWDGAQSADVIAANHATRKRYTREDAIANRNAFYDEWINGKLRYRKDGSGKDMDVVPELRFHWTFDSLPGAENAKRVLQAPHGFLDQSKPRASRPLGYEVPWWSGIVGAYKSVYAGERNWVPWIPNTVTHLPRFDGSTLDSAYWSEDAAGDEPGIYRFARTAEPVSKWTQMVRNLTESSLQFQTGNRRYWHSYNTGTNGTSMLSRLFEFTGRHLNQTGDDLLPLGGAFAKYVDTMWDDQGASTLWEQTGVDVDNDGLPDWWQEYAEQNYRKDGVPAEGVDITWDTVINYNVGGSRVLITAGEAYLRDLAKGTYVDAAGKVQIGPTDYIQTADADANGIPDWWAEMYGIRGESGLADHDNDGLPNYVEYLLSEVFAFKTIFDPTVPDSVQRGVPDYFYRPAGCQLYVGEIFTDHDLVDDAWEDLYAKKDPLDAEIYASRLAWDAFADTDEDGWSNRSENRYAKAVMPIVANKQAHYTPADGLVADYPIPTLSLKLRYNGNPQNAVSKAPIAVQVTTDATLAKDPDATYLIGAVAEQTPGTGTTSDKESVGTEVARTRTIGKWSDRRVIGTLTPGNIKIDSIKLQNCYDPSSTTYSWRITDFTEIFRGTRAEYDDALRKYGSDNVELVSTTAGYKDLQDLTLTSDEKSIVATWTTKAGDTLGTVNLVTGEFELDLGVFKGWTVSDASATNRTESTAMEDQTYRIAYATNPSVGLPRELYLGEADTGHVKEGKNTIIAWAETVAEDGVWQPGEPYGIVRDVDVSWRGTSAEIELTDLSPVTPRITFGGSSASSSGGASSGGSGASSGASEVDPSSDRGRTFDWICQDILDRSVKVPAWIANNRIEPVTLRADEFRGQRIRVVRWLVNDVPVYTAGTSPRVVLDKMIETDVRNCLTEADLLVGNNAFDIDWENLQSEVADNIGTQMAVGGDVTRVCYLVVVGDGPVAWYRTDATNTVKALNTVIVRTFGKTHVAPVAVAPGAAGEEIVRSANPTFKWTMDCLEEEGYTAFNVQVLDGTTVIYDSDKVFAPPRNDKGQYVWSAPLFVGDRTLKGEVFENKKAYTWKVSMYNAKYSNTAAYSNAGRFFMEVQTNGYDYGSANVAVRYFGPTSTWSKKNPVIRVRAYTSPDFTGLPVAAGYVAKPDDPANGLLAGTNAAPNCTVVGIPRGTYYLQAFIDSNGNGACDPWETQGYLCTRDGSKPDYLDPTAITFDSKIGKGDLAVIYLEDADTDGDGLPDAWEWAEYGSLAAKGVELLTETKAGEFVVNEDLSGKLALQENAPVPTAGLAGEIKSTIMKLRSPAGVSAATGIDPADIEVTDGGLEVKSEVDPETLTIVGFDIDTANKRVLLKVGAETTANVDAAVARFLNIRVQKGAEVTVRVERAESPAGPWEVLEGVGGTVTVDRAGTDIEVNLTGELPAQGFFRARIEE